MIAYDTTLVDVLTDNLLPHEVPLLGLPIGYSWAKHPEADAWNNIPAGMAAITGWACAYWTGSATPGVLHVRRFRVYSLSDAGWTLIQSGQIDGAAFRPDFAGNVAHAAQIVANGEGWEVTFGRDACFHFWPHLRAKLPAGHKALLVLLQARSDSPDMLMGCGADYWLSVSAPFDANKTNPCVGIGRYKRIPSWWKWFGFTTATPEQLQGFDF